MGKDMNPFLQTRSSCIPIVLVVPDTINNSPSRRKFTALLDSGADDTWISKSALPLGCKVCKIPKLRGNTLAGPLESSEAVYLNKTILPEFSTTHKIMQFPARVVNDMNCRYDIIIGRDLMSELRMRLDFDEHVVTWKEVGQYPMRPKYDVQSHRTKSDLRDALWLDMRIMNDAANDEDLFATEILDAKYAKADLEQVVRQCSHLSFDKQSQLLALLRKHQKLFDNKLRKYPYAKVHLELEEGAKPVHKRHYPVPRIHQTTFKKELDRLESLGILERTGPSEWAAPTFITPKKDGTVRWVSDFRGLNKLLKRKQYPLPKIADILSRRSRYKFFTKLDVSMEYYTFELDEESQDLCVIATPFGLYKYKRLPMGVKVSPDIAQDAIEKIFHDIDNEDVEAYIDDVGCFSNDWNEHLNLLDKVLSRLDAAGFMLNPLKCEWGVQETDWLGHWLTPTGIKPWKKKVDAVMLMQRPQNTTQLRSFLGSVQWYRDMWPRRAHILAPLTELVGKKGFTWQEKHQKAFKQMKALMLQDALLSYPDVNLPFDIETDASDYQLGAVVKQNGRPIAYYSRKLSDAQRNYTTIEKELLSVVETLKAFRSLLQGGKINIYTDHKNLTHSLTAFQTQRVLRWRLFLEEFQPSFFYIKGQQNVVADTLSRLPRAGSSSLVGKEPSQNFVSDENENFFISLIDDVDLAECFLVHPIFDTEERHPLSYNTIREYQQKDNALKEAAQNALKEQYIYKQLGDSEIICYVPAENPSSWKIAIPDGMLNNLVQWYHLSVAHTAGVTRLYETMKQRFHHPNLYQAINNYKCDACQKMKGGSRQYGELPPRDVLVAPWHDIHVDLIGPWKITVQGMDLYFNALTVIDPVTNLLEIYRIQEKSSYYVGQQLENGWFARYPRPMRCVHDQGPEFRGSAFTQILENHGVEDVSTTIKNPQANAICERIHQTVGTVLRTLCHVNPPQNMLEASDLMDNCLATAMHATRAVASNATDKIAPGALVFQRDMFLDVPLVADIIAITQKRELAVNESLRKANLQRLNYDYNVNDQVLVKVFDPDKLDPRYEGPYQVLQVHVNGTLTIQRSPNITERISIRRLKPHRE